MSSQTACTLLISRLPPHPLSLWNTQYKPVSRLHLENSLKLLTDNEAKQLKLIEQLIIDSKRLQPIPQKHKVDAIIDRLHSPLAKKVVQWHLELRTIIAALRQRQLERDKPEPRDQWGYGDSVPVILNNWQLDDFGLSTRFPWIKSVIKLLEQHDPYRLEKMLLDLNWQYYTRLGQGHYFDFNAVIIYVLRWDIVHRRTTYDEQKALTRFKVLLNEGLGKTISH